MNYDFRIYTVHNANPHDGPGGDHRRWMAFSADPLPVLVSHAIDMGMTLQSIKLVQPEFCYGKTRSEAINALREQLIERIAGLKAKGITIEQTDLTITETEVREAPKPPSLTRR